MIFNDDLLFLHIPKTAGKSLAIALVDVLPRPVHCFVPPGTEALLRDHVDDLAGVSIERSNGHENMWKAERVLPEMGRSIDDFKVVLVAIRNPYDLLVSNYFFMRETYEHNVGNERFELAHNSDFETYAREITFFPVERWLTTKTGVPDTRRVLRFEHLQEDFDAAMAELGYPTRSLEVVNASRHGHYRDYLTPVVEEAVYEKFRYLFDQGFYDRER